MNAPRRPPPGEGTPAEHDPAIDALLEYLAGTALAPAPDLASRIQVRISREPDRTPIRRFLLALVHLRLAMALGAFRQLIRVAGGKGSFPALLRAQALGLVLVTALSAVALGVGAAASVQRVIAEYRPVPTEPAPTLPSPAATLLPTASVRPTEGPTSPSPRPQADGQLPHPTPTPGATPRPVGEGDRPGRTQKPGNDTGSSSGPTAHPTRTPRPTKTPRPEPTRTARPSRTPRPTERPEPTDQPEPAETPEPDHEGGHDGPEGVRETDPPDDGWVWSGGVLSADLVPPSGPHRSEGPA